MKFDQNNNAGASFFLPMICDGEDKSSPFKNCLRNNYRHIRKWAKRTETNCFRIYDKHIVQYPLAIDFYDGRFCIHYFPRSRLEEEPSPNFVVEVENALLDIFQSTPDMLFWRNRVRRAKTEQYEKVDESHDFFEVLEYGAKFKINLTDYLDTGLFLDHRETRQMVRKSAKGKSLLNLFSYTGAFSVQAALAGAIRTKSVDMSNTYTLWAQDNFLLNKISLKSHEFVRADCLKFILDEQRLRELYDIIVIDPPTISRSKKMDQLFDIQVDYIFLIQNAVRLLAPKGTLFFSTNSRKFSFDESLFPDLFIRNISEKTLPIDFKDPKIHRCWKLEKKLTEE